MPFRSRSVSGVYRLLLSLLLPCCQGVALAQEDGGLNLQARVFDDTPPTFGAQQPFWKARFGEASIRTLRLELGFSKSRSGPFSELRRGSLLKMQIDATTQLALRARSGKVALIWQTRW